MLPRPRTPDPRPAGTSRMLKQRVGGAVQRGAPGAAAGGETVWASTAAASQASQAAVEAYAVADEHDVEATVHPIGELIAGDSHPLAESPPSVSLSHGASSLSQAPPFLRARDETLSASWQRVGPWPWRPILGAMALVVVLYFGVGWWRGPQIARSALDPEVGALRVDVAVRNEKASADAEVAFQLGLESYFGLSGLVDKVGAAMWFHKAAELGHSGGQYYEGICLFDGSGTIEDVTQATVWIERAAAQGHAEAQSVAGLLAQANFDRRGNLAHAVAWYRKAADQGDANAQLRLGLSLYRGEGVMANRAEAVMWFRRAAEQHITNAQFILGMCYRKADGVEGNKTEAVAWYRRAAAQDHAEAQVNLGLSYWTGEGVVSNRPMASSCFQSAANRKHPDAMFNVAVSQYSIASNNGYEYRASSLMSEAAATDHPGALFQEGLFLKKQGRRDAAVVLFRKAAVQGHPLARLTLGLMYVTGEEAEGGVPDLVKAKNWLRKAAGQSVAAAKAKLLELEMQG